ncbi:MAG: spermidine synthase [Chromatiales bacterium]
MAASDRPSRYLLFSVFAISGAALGTEILLVRLFSIVQWHHFAYLIISVALLGYAVSGTVLAIRPPPSAQTAGRLYVACGLGFAVSACGAFLLSQLVPFNPLAILWDGREWLHLLATYLILAVPFFFASSCICLMLACFRRQQPVVYGCDLAGAGCGAAATVGLLWWLPPVACLATLAVVIAVAVLLGWRGFAGRFEAAPVLIVLVIAALALLAAQVPVRMSEYKSLSRTLQILSAGVAAERSSPLGVVTAVENSEVPFRHAPGLSLNATATPPAQIALFTDGEGMSVITRYDGNSATVKYLKDLPSALPYALAPAPSVLILGGGGGVDVLDALVHGARRVDVVELNPQVVEMVRHRFSKFAGNLYADPRVHVHVAEARQFVSTTPHRFDLIELSPLDALSTAASGVHALSESHLYTREAVQEYLGRLAPGGLLAMSRWAQLPPRDDLKLFATAVEALRRLHRQPERHLLWLRSWNLSVIVVGNAPLTPAQIETAKSFAQSRWFDLAWYPGMTATEANRYNVWPEAYDYLGAAALLGERAEAFIADYKFNVRPATDDRPYFFHFFRWRVLPEVLSLGRERGMALLDLGYFVLVAALAQALLVSVLLVALPVWWWQRRLHTADRPGREPRIPLYFGAIGLGFMFVELACIQKFMLYLHHPLYAIAVVLTGMLLFSGLGSLLGMRGGAFTRRAVRRAIGVIIALLLFHMAILPALFDWSGGMGDGGRILITLSLLAPLAMAMGQPFPLALRAVGERDSRLIPWAFAINGCASVVGAMLATLTMMHAGYIGAVVAAAVLYLLAAWSVPASTG